MHAQVTARDPGRSAQTRRREVPWHKNPFVEKRAHHRRRSCLRALGHVTVPLSPAVRTARRARLRPSWQRGLIGGLVLVLSVGLHVLLVLSALGISRLGARVAKPREKMVIELREVAPKQQPEPKPPRKEAQPESPQPERVRARWRASQARVEAPKPKVPPKGPPPRVVGLTFESTTGESGEGPAFAVGNTHQGGTERTAAAPKLVPRETIMSGPSATSPNRLATRLPMAGVTYTQPKIRKRAAPVYPPTLKTQGVESEVVVLVSIDTLGKVTKVRILKESPYPEFNQAAKTAAMADEFEPATRNGGPIPYSLKYTIFFRLKDE